MTESWKKRNVFGFSRIKEGFERVFTNLLYKNWDVSLFDPTFLLQYALDRFWSPLPAWRALEALVLREHKTVAFLLIMSFLAAQ